MAEPDFFTLNTEDFETLLICSERYACGRRSYMPSLVIGIITPLISSLRLNTLLVMDQDLSFAGSYGDPEIDEPLWRELHKKIREEISRRKETA